MKILHRTLFILAAAVLCQAILACQSVAPMLYAMSWSTSTTFLQAVFPRLDMAKADRWTPTPRMPAAPTTAASKQ